MKNWLPVLLFATAIIACGMWLYSQQASLLPKEPETSGLQDRDVLTMYIAGQPIQVEAVTTPESIALGLSGRTAIGQDGMLFVLPERRIASFWMKDMLFDLDLIWIDGETITNITPNVPAPSPGTQLSDLPSYSSNVLVTMVLEVPAGTAREKNWKIGDVAVLRQE